MEPVTMQETPSPLPVQLTPIRFGEFLLERQAIDDGQLLDALAEHWQSGLRLGDVIATRGHLAKQRVEELAGEYHGLDVLEVEA